MPPEVVLMRASSTVLVKASSLVNRDLAGIVMAEEEREARKLGCEVENAKLLRASRRKGAARWAS